MLGQGLLCCGQAPVAWLPAAAQLAPPAAAAPGSASAIPRPAHCHPAAPRLQVSLALLHETGISAAVAQLRTHPSTAVAGAADAIVQRWRTCAVAALEQAEAGLLERRGR